MFWLLEAEALEEFVGGKEEGFGGGVEREVACGGDVAAFIFVGFTDVDEVAGGSGRVRERLDLWGDEVRRFGGEGGEGRAHLFEAVYF